MIKYIFKLFILLVSFGLSFSTSVSNENKIIVKVENQIITSYELKNKIKTILFFSNQIINQENINKTKKQALFALINDKLKKNEITKYNLIIDNESIKNKLLSIASNDVPALKKNFEKNNLNYQLLIDEIKTELSWQKLIYTFYNEKVKINDIDFEKQIEDLIENETNIEEYKISEIEFPLEEGSKKNEKIKFIINKIEELGFEETALRYSTSSSSQKKGDLGWFNTKALSSQFFNILNKLNKGEVSKPITSLNNILFLKLEDKKISKINSVDIEKLKKNLIAQKKNELFNLYSKSHLSKIKNNALIIYK